MNPGRLINKATSHLNKLCLDIDNRRTGSAGNRAATDYFAEVVSGFGFAVETPSFECLDWETGGAELKAAGMPFVAYPSPYTLDCSITGPLEAVTSINGLDRSDLTGKVLLLHGKIASEQIIPKNFPFYKPEHHQELVQLLESKNPLAIVAATGRDPQMVGAQYPFPLFEDGDFDIPSVYMKDVDGKRLAGMVGTEITLKIQTERRPAVGCNVVARAGQSFPQRVVLFAHIDAKMGTSGAWDNASGVVVLLLLAEMLAGYDKNLGIEIVAVNGEDYYSNPGEQQYLTLNAGTFEDIVLGVNIDGVGYQKSKVGYSLYLCDPGLSSKIQRQFVHHENIVPGEPWYTGDHALFLMNQVPTLALTSEPLDELMMEIAHTPKDTPDILQTSLLPECAEALHALLLQWSNS